jgi:hypothetical protein
MTPEEVENRMKTKRFALINVWRNILESPILKSPLAFCDSRTVGKECYQTAKDNKTYYSYDLQAKQTEEHRWFYYSLLSNEECVMFM